jgi:hypothetical protein
LQDRGADGAGEPVPGLVVVSRSSPVVSETKTLRCDCSVVGEPGLASWARGSAAPTGLAFVSRLTPHLRAGLSYGALYSCSIA